MSEAAGVTVADRIAELVQQHGSLRAAALVVRTNPGYLSRLAPGDPVDRLLARGERARLADTCPRDLRPPNFPSPSDCAHS